MAVPPGSSACEAEEKSPEPFWRELASLGMHPREWAAIPGVEPDAASIADAHALLAQWVARFPDEAAFDEHLRLIGLNRAQAARQWMQRRLPPGTPLPDWVARLRRLLANGGAGTPNVTRPTAAGQGPQWPEFLAPFTRALRQRLVPVECLFAEEAALEALGTQLLAVLSRLCSRTLAQELRQLSQDGALRGSDGRERFDDFAWRFCADPAWRLSVLRRHPVLARHLSEVSTRFEDNVLQCLARLDAESGCIARHFGWRPARLRVTALRTGMSDPHAGGHSVSLLQLDGGVAVLHKPRSSAIDGWFDAWAGKLGEGDDAGVLGAPRHLDCGTHSWVAFVDRAECRSPAEVDCFHRRQGALLALAWFLSGGDFHHENVIAAGDRPVLVDLEGLLLPGDAHAVAGSDPEVPWQEPLARSVLGTGLSPVWVAGGDDGSLFVSSGLLGIGDRPPGVLWPRWVDIGSDALHLELLPVQLAEPPCRPRLEGRDVPLTAGLASLVAGFEMAYDTLRLCTPDLVPPAPGCRSRIILRNTRAYEAMLERLLAPDLLVSAVHHDAAIGRLLAAPLLVPSLGASVHEAERQSLWRRDIPCFVADPLTGEVAAAGASSETVGTVTPGVQEVARRFALAGPGHRAWSSALLRASIHVAAEPLVGGAATADEALDFMAPVRAIGEAMLRQAVRGTWGATWLDFHRDGNGHVGQHVAGAGLYAGASGIALALACMAHALDRDSHAQAAREGLQYAAKWWATPPAWHPPFLHGSEGPLGLAWAEAACGCLLDDSALIARGLDRAARLQLALEAGADPDFLGGLAGSLAILVSLHELSGDSTMLTLASRMAGRIVAAERAPAQGGGWAIRGRAVLGLAHGAAGIAMALSRLYAHTHEPQWREAVTRALAFEGRHFDATVGDWPDLRAPADAAATFMSGWCAGAAGAGLARAVVSEALGTEAPASLAAEIESAAMAVCRHAGSTAGGDHLCCGEAGRLMFLARAAGDQPRLGAVWCDAAKSLLRRVDASGRFTLSEIRESRVAHGLFTGTGGIAIALLAASGTQLLADPLVLAIRR